MVSACCGVRVHTPQFARTSYKVPESSRISFYQMNRFLQLPLLSPPNLKAPFAPLLQGLLRSHGCRAVETPKDQVGVSSNNSLSRFRTYCTSKDLLIKKCVPCNTKELRPMTDGAADSLMPQVAGWNLVKEGGVMKLRQSWKVKSFTKGLEFFKIVADLAENEGHHPDLHLVGWNNVTIEIWTHAIGGLTENDFILAAKINKLPLDHLLRRKAAE
ncbi:pterin-4-alpha-carbinolamine dehydratase 2, mitochondrial isoform X2 [Prosopis cineraria]|uniref:pterin-4-alpha-carbinolamine dehydratase 2, mitochondrial isoform X2 n=1 Tax=Prosopis cineraria TaxID=364024 RepID=UPI00240EA6B7|nr:pterin-4-alpha-carbinolamine dehydratase 2, mitochondrial isoform X2 [Prosopis cineraria]